MLYAWNLKRFSETYRKVKGDFQGQNEIVFGNLPFLSATFYAPELLRPTLKDEYGKFRELVTSVGRTNIEWGYICKKNGYLTEKCDIQAYTSVL